MAEGWGLIHRRRGGTAGQKEREEERQGGCRAGCKALKLSRFIAAWTGLASLDSGWLPLKRGPYCW